MQRINLNLLPAHIIEQLFKKNSSLMTSSMQDAEGDNETGDNHNKNLADAKHTLAYTLTMNQLKKADINYGNILPDELQCRCDICFSESAKMNIEHREEINEEFFENFDFVDKDAKNNNDYEKDFIYIIKRLMPYKNVTSTLRLNVPDTVAFIGGEAKFRVSTGEDKTLRFTRQKEKLTLQEINKLFQAKFRSSQIEVAAPVIDEDIEPSTPTRTLKRGTLTDIDSAYSTILDKESKNHTKKNNLYRNIVMRDQLGKNELALVKFNDGSTRTLCEREFEQIIFKRKCDGFWRIIQYLQVFARVKASVQNMKRFYFVYDREKNNPLFDKAKVEVLFLNGEDPATEGDYTGIERNYFTIAAEEKFEASILENNENDYYLYLLMKIFHFLDIIHGVKITKMCGEFVREERGLVWLFNISRLRYIQSAANIKEEIGAGLLGLMAPLKSQRLTVALHGYFKNLERMQAVKILNKALQHEYKYIRKKTSANQGEYYYQDNISDEVFAKIHPNAPFKLSDMIRKEYPYDKIQEFLHNNLDRLKLFHQYIHDGKEAKIPVKKSFSDESAFASNEINLLRSSKSLQKALPSNRSSIKSSRAKDVSNAPIAKLPSIQNLNKRSLSVPKMSSDSATERSSLNISAKSFKISVNGMDQVEFDNSRKHSGNQDDLTLINPTSSMRDKTSNDSVTMDHDASRDNSSYQNTKSYSTLIKLSSRARSTTQARKSSNQLTVLDARRYSEMKAKIENKQTASGYTKFVLSNSLPFLLNLESKALSEKLAS